MIQRKSASNVGPQEPGGAGEIDCYELVLLQWQRDSERAMLGGGKIYSKANRFAEEGRCIQSSFVVDPAQNTNTARSVP